METKLVMLQCDLFDFIHDKYEDFTFDYIDDGLFRIEYLTDGTNEAIRFKSNDTPVISPEYCTHFDEIMKEVANKIIVYEKLFRILNSFFKQFTNKELDEKYEVGIEGEEGFSSEDNPSSRDFYGDFKIRRPSEWVI